MTWALLAVLFAAIAGLWLALRFTRKNLKATRARVKEPPVFGLENLQDLSDVIANPDAGKVLNAVLANLGVHNTVAEDYKGFRKRNEEHRERRFSRVRSNEGKIEILRRDIQRCEEEIQTLWNESGKVGELVANVLPSDAQ